MNVSDAGLVRAIRGPITLITVGVLFALNNFTPYQFHQTWPVLLIVFGLLSLLRRGVEPPRPVGPQGFGPPAPPPYSYPPPVSGAGNYRQSQYPDAPPASEPAKGGFGSSAGSAPGNARSEDTPGGPQ